MPSDRSLPVLRALVECHVLANPPVGFQTSEKTITLDHPLVERATSFSFDSLQPYSVDNLQNQCPVADLLKDYSDAGMPGPGDLLSSSLFFHGSSLPETASIFAHAVEGALSQLAHREPGIGADMRLLRIYSWGAIDVIAQRMIEHRGRMAVSSVGTSDGNMAGADRHRVLSDRLHLELPRVRRLLSDALIVPEGHCIISCAINVVEDRFEGIRTLYLCLLPPLRHVNRLMRKDLLGLRRLWCEYQRPSSLSASSTRLARFFTEPITHGNTYVFTILGTTSTQNVMRDFYVQCCYGSSRPCNMTERECDSFFRSSPSPTGMHPWNLSIQNNCAASEQVLSTKSTERRLFFSSPRNSQKCSDEPTYSMFRSDSFPDVAPSQKVMESSPGDSRMSMITQEHPEQPATDQPQCCEVNLTEKVKVLQDEIYYLEQYKFQLESAVGLILESLKEATTTLFVEESAMLTEVERAASILALTDASSRAQEEHILSRLSALLSNSRSPTRSTRSDQTGL